MPDAELSARAAAGDLRNESVLLAQVRRMLKDERAQPPGHGVRRQLARLPALRRAQRGRSRALSRVQQRAARGDVRGADPVHQRRRSATTARCSTCCTAATRSPIPFWRSTTGCREVNGSADEWVRIDNARDYQRGGLLPMAAFLTQNSPGLRTSPVKRGYWVARRVLGEVIPPPPPTVPGAAKGRGQAGPAAAGRCWRSIATIRVLVVPCAVRFVRADVRRLRPGRRNADERPGRPRRRHAGDVSRRKPGGRPGGSAELHPREPRKRLFGQP